MKKRLQANRFPVFAEVEGEQVRIPNLWAVHNGTDWVTVSTSHMESMPDPSPWVCRGCPMWNNQVGCTGVTCQEFVATYGRHAKPLPRGR